jgi:steroid 5-alpha reductase family enzyme
MSAITISAESWGADFQRRMFWFLQIQAAAAILLAICILLAARHPASGIRLVDWVGVLILAVAIGGEGIADAQLKRFKANPANKGGICDVGLWGWSRHPNYFFEWLVWAAFAVMAVDFSGAYLWGWLALFGPISMYWLLVYVSGIPPLETLMLKSRGDAYRRYQATTHAFFPHCRPGGTIPPSRKRPIHEHDVFRDQRLRTPAAARFGDRRRHHLPVRPDPALADVL